MKDRRGVEVNTDMGLYSCCPIDSHTILGGIQDGASADAACATAFKPRMPEVGDTKGIHRPTTLIWKAPTEKSHHIR